MARVTIPKLRPNDIEGINTWAQGDEYNEIYAGVQPDSMTPEEYLNPDPQELQSDNGMNGNWRKMTIYVNKLRYLIDNIITDIQDATPTRRGLVNTTEQSFGGKKNFHHSISVGKSGEINGYVQLKNSQNNYSGRIITEEITKNIDYVLPNTNNSVVELITNEELNAHKDSSDHDNRYVNKTNDEEISGKKTFKNDITIDSNANTAELDLNANGISASFGLYKYTSYLAQILRIKTDYNSDEWKYGLFFKANYQGDKYVPEKIISDFPVLELNGKKVLTEDDLTYIVDTSSDQEISGKKTFKNDITIDSNANTAELDLNANGISASFGLYKYTSYLAQILRIKTDYNSDEWKYGLFFKANYQGDKYVPEKIISDFPVLELNGKKVLTEGDLTGIVDTSSEQEISGKKTFKDNLEVTKTSNTANIGVKANNIRSEIGSYNYSDYIATAVRQSLKPDLSEYTYLLFGKSNYDANQGKFVPQEIMSDFPQLRLKGKKVATEEYVQQRIKTGIHVVQINGQANVATDGLNMIRLTPNSLPILIPIGMPCKLISGNVIATDDVNYLGGIVESDTKYEFTSEELMKDNGYKYIVPMILVTNSQQGKLIEFRLYRAMIDGTSFEIDYSNPIYINDKIKLLYPQVNDININATIYFTL